EATTAAKAAVGTGFNCTVMEMASLPDPHELVRLDAPLHGQANAIDTRGDGATGVVQTSPHQHMPADARQSVKERRRAPSRNVEDIHRGIRDSRYLEARMNDGTGGIRADGKLGAPPSRREKARRP